MDLELFRKLGVGAKFNFKRFQKDAVRLKIIKPQICQPSDEIISEKVYSNIENEVSKTVENVTDEKDIQLIAGLSSDNNVKKKKKSLLYVKAQHEEKINEIRKSNKIHAIGSDLSDPIENFADLEVSNVILNNVKNLGYEKPTPIQMQAIPLMIQRRELFACAPTGSGKTAAFIIPILRCLEKPMRKGFRAVIVAPTRELAKQIFREFYRLSIGLKFRIHMIDDVKSAAKKFGSTSKKFDILVSTPKRLIYLLQQTPPAISLSSVEWLIVDESDKLFETGFRDQLAVIYQACDSASVRRAMFSATYTSEVEEWCQLNLDNLAAVFIGDVNSATDLVKQELIFVGNEDGKLIAFRDHVRQGFTPPLLVFVKTKERAQQLFFELIYDGINVDVIHADRTQLQRDNVVKCFREGKIWVLITTELMGRGIDFKGVNIVINYDLPTSPISYIHRIGRTGRAGRSGTAITYFTENDAEHLHSIASLMKQAGCPIPEYLLTAKLKRKTIQKNTVPFKKRKFNNNDNTRSYLKKKLKKQKSNDKNISFKERTFKKKATVNDTKKSLFTENKSLKKKKAHSNIKFKLKKNKIQTKGVQNITAFP